MTQYEKGYKLPIVIPAESMDNLLANVMAVSDLRNLRVAETEKYAHVTYFFNGGIEKPFGGAKKGNWSPRRRSRPTISRRRCLQPASQTPSSRR